MTAVADPAAAAVGTRFGSGTGKTWAGSAACAAGAVLVLLLTGASLGAAVAAGLGAAAAERAPWGGADNVLVPVVVAALLRVLA